MTGNRGSHTIDHIQSNLKRSFQILNSRWGVHLWIYRKQLFKKASQYYYTEIKRIANNHAPYIVFYNKLPCFVSELPENNISNVVVHSLRAQTSFPTLILCSFRAKNERGKWRLGSQTRSSSVGIVFYNKLSWFVSGLWDYLIWKISHKPW
jgi:hypothetical protein